MVVNNAEIEKQIAISINSREYYYYKWKPLIDREEVSTSKDYTQHQNCIDFSVLL